MGRLSSRPFRLFNFLLLRFAVAGFAVRAVTIELRGFGAFSVKQREARKGRNPRTGETVAVDQKVVPFFKTGKELRDRLNLARGAEGGSTPKPAEPAGAAKGPVTGGGTGA